MHPNCAQEQANRYEIAGLYAAGLSLTEISIGSYLHALHVPFTGTLLSLNQSCFLSQTVKSHKHRPDIQKITLDISLVTALLKSFSPAGRKITPMIAISAQGVLYSLGIHLFGPTYWGAIIGSLLLTIWGIIQPIFTAGIMFHTLSLVDQSQIIHGWQKLSSEFPFPASLTLIQALAIALTIKALTQIALTTWIWKRESTDSIFSQFNSNTSKFQARFIAVQDSMAEKTSFKKILLGSLRDLRDPVILTTVILLSGLSYIIDSDLQRATISAIRMIAGIYLTYFTLRAIPFQRLFQSKSGFSKALEATLKRLTDKT
jgi:hypothetical protein